MIRFGKANLKVYFRVPDVQKSTDITVTTAAITTATITTAAITTATITTAAITTNDLKMITVRESANESIFDFQFLRESSRESFLRFCIFNFHFVREVSQESVVFTTLTDSL